MVQLSLVQPLPEYLPMSVWNLEDSLKLIRSLQPETRRFNYHLCLGGGVLNKGESDKDLDLVFVPMDNGKGSDPNGLLAFLKTLWGEAHPFSTPDGEAQANSALGSIFRNVWGVSTPTESYSDNPFETTVYRHKLKFYFDGSYRIDVFIMNPAIEIDSTVEQEPTISIDLETPAQPPIDGGPGTSIRYQTIPYRSPASTSRWDGIVGQAQIPVNHISELRNAYTYGDVTRSTEPAWRASQYNAPASTVGAAVANEYEQMVARDAARQLADEQIRRQARLARDAQARSRQYVYIDETAAAPTDSELDDLLDDDYDDVDE